jgi:hypothetical protein
MERAVGRVDPVHYALDDALRPDGFALRDRDESFAAGHPAAHYEHMRALLPSYPPRATQDDLRFGVIQWWSRASRAWCGAWILYALLALGLLGVIQRDAALVFLTGAAFAQLAASALGDKPWPGHFDPVAPLFLAALAIAARTRRSESAATSAAR